MPRTSQRTLAKNNINSTDYDTILAEYKIRYNVDTLDSPNDLANLRQMIRNQILITRLQDQMEELSKSDDFSPTELKKVLDSIVALSEVNVTLERTLGIDRKTRKNETSESTADYLLALKLRAKEFLDDPRRLTKVMCKECNILVGRLSGVYDSTAFQAAFQCPQCQKMITIQRKERDVLFGVKDAEWRKKYPIEIIQAKRSEIPNYGIEPEVIIGDDNES